MSLSFICVSPIDSSNAPVRGESRVHVYHLVFGNGSHQHGMIYVDHEVHVNKDLSPTAVDECDLTRAFFTKANQRVASFFFQCCVDYIACLNLSSLVSLSNNKIPEFCA
jgi:hypothetical protein